jgi:hypothetical protein
MSSSTSPSGTIVARNIMIGVVPRCRELLHSRRPPHSVWGRVPVTGIATPVLMVEWGLAVLLLVQI